MSDPRGTLRLGGSESGGEYMSSTRSAKGGCRKIRYRDRLEALIALSGVGGNRHTRRTKDEIRAYECPRCKGWHLTSQTSRVTEPARR